MVSSERLARVVADQMRARPGCALVLGRTAIAVGEREVELADGERLSGRLIVDARGPDRYASRATVAYQKFCGLELELARPSSRTRPLLMDARVAQVDGFRFFYVLPLTPTRVLIEDTAFSDHALLDRERMQAAVLEYAKTLGFSEPRVRRREHGVLPLPLRADAEPPGRPLRAGYQGGWFHPTTGYSFPVAARLAGLLASAEPEAVDASLERAWNEHARQLRFACFLNRLLFAACAPDRRVGVLERFYRMPAPAIRRFYALKTTAADRARIVCGRPPRGVSIGAAIRQGVLS